MKIRFSPRRLARSGFTLMEMMLVLAIIALLIAVGAVTLSNVSGGAEITAAQAQINTIKTAMISYKNHNRSFPGQLEDLVKPPSHAKVKRKYIEEQGIVDPWGEKYQLRVPGKTSGDAYDIYSMGPDKRDGTDDDVTLDRASLLFAFPMKILAGLRRCTSSRGFTLLEIIVVLSIMMLMITVGVAAFRFYDDEDPFEEPVTKLRHMSKTALHMATLQHRGQTIAFDKKGFMLVGSTAAGGGYYSVPADMKILIYRWGGKSWEDAEGHLWPFGQQGICEPVKVRFETKEDSREVAFHPLTGTPIEF